MQFLTRPIGFLTATMFLNFAGLTIIIPVIPYIVAEYTDHVALYVGLITSLASFFAFIVAPALGYMSDHIGRRPVILLSLLGGVVGYVMFGIGGALWVLFVSRVIDGLSSGDTTAMYAYVADAYPPEDRTKYYGMLGAAAAFGFMIGPAIGGLAATVNLSMPLYVAAGLALLNALWGYFALPESLEPEHRTKTFEARHLNPLEQFRAIAGSFTLRMLFIITAIFFIGIVLQQGNFSVFLKDILKWGPTNIGIVLTVVGLVDFLAEGYLAGKLTKIFGQTKVLNAGIMLTALGMVMVGFVSWHISVWLLYAAVILFSLGDGLFEPVMTGMIADATAPDMHGRIQGANQATQSLARVISPLVAGVLYEWGAYLPYFMSAALMIIALFVIVFWRPPLTLASK